MGETIVKRYVNVPYIQGSVLKAQRKAAGMSVQMLSDRLKAITGIRISTSQLFRLESMDEFPVEPEMLGALQQIMK